VNTNQVTQNTNNQADLLGKTMFFKVLTNKGAQINFFFSQNNSGDLVGSLPYFAVINSSRIYHIYPKLFPPKTDPKFSHAMDVTEVLGSLCKIALFQFDCNQYIAGYNYAIANVGNNTNRTETIFLTSSIVWSRVCITTNYTTEFPEFFLSHKLFTEPSPQEYANISCALS
jgi:hypothetical protein